MFKLLMLCQPLKAVRRTSIFWRLQFLSIVAVGGKIHFGAQVIVAVI